MPTFAAGLHLHVVSLGHTHRICAVWRVVAWRDCSPLGAPADDLPCAFSGALLLPRRGAEQRWAVETAVATLDEGDAGDGPVCVDLTTTAEGIEPGAVRPGLCRSEELLELARAATGDGQREWADLARDAPAAFHARAGDPYPLQRHAAAVTLRSPDGPGSPDRRVRLLHRRPQDVLRGYTTALLANAANDSTTPDASRPRRP